MRPPLILMVNGNSRAELTDRMCRHAERTLGGKAELEPMTIATGPAFVSNRVEATLAAAAILTAVGGRLADRGRPRPDAIMLACFGEPGLLALRETLPVPVLGMVEASVHTALQLGRRVSILTSGRCWPSQIADLLELYGQSSRVLRITAVPDDGLSDNEEIWRPALSEAVRRDADMGGADSIILGGGPLSGRAATLTPPDGVTLIDAFEATLWQSLALASLRHPGGSD